MVWLYNEILLINEKKQITNHTICMKSQEDYAEWKKPDSEKSYCIL